MLVYILKRILYFIPTFFIISLITFLLSLMAPGDPIEDKLNRGKSAEGGISEKRAGEQSYLELNEKYGRDLPSFYFSITSASYPDTLYRIYRKNQRENLDRFIDMYGNWQEIETYYHAIHDLEYALIALPADPWDTSSYTRTTTLRDACGALYVNTDSAFINIVLGQAHTAATQTIQIEKEGHLVSYNCMEPVKEKTEKMISAYHEMVAKATPHLKYVPALHWYGLHNQYHRWIFGDVPWFGTNNDPAKSCKGLLRLDFGISYVDNRPVASILGDALRWTLLINFITFLLIYTVGVYLGVKLAVKRGTTYERAMTAYLFVQYSIPSFWIGTLLIVFFTNDYYAGWMNIFPPYGLGKIGSDYTLMARVTDRAYHLILPVFCITLGSFAYISRQMRGAMVSVLRQDYIRTAFAKGLAPNSVFWKHAFRNSLIPIITLFSGFLPAMIGGSVIIEFLFTIPGMGLASYSSVGDRNFPILFTILMASAVLTMFGTLLSDILYAITDPRISFTKKQR